jgi:large subunit ribosomal protein L22
MEARARARFVRVSPRKARRAIDMIRGLPVSEARRVLALSQLGAATPVRKCLDSAVANAEHTPGVVPENLMVSRVYVDEGPTLKRWRARARGRAARIDKKTSHLSVVLTPTTD